MAKSTGNNLVGDLQDALLEPGVRGHIAALDVARRLAPDFEEIIKDFKADIPLAKARREQAVQHEAAAADLDARSEELVKTLLSYKKRRIQEAVEQGYLPGVHDHRWAAGEQAEVALSDLRRDCELWRKRAALAARHSRGRKTGDQHLLADLVALRLSRQGVPLAKSRKGAFARVLGVVFVRAGVRANADHTDLYPHVRRVLEDKDIGQWLLRAERRRSVNSRRRIFQ